MPANRNLPRIACAVAAALLSLAMLGCGGPSSSGDGQDRSSSGDIPELTREVINERINGARVRDVLPENANGQPIPWGFDEDEPKEIVVVDQQMQGTRATIVLDIKTQSSPRASNMRQLSGQIRTEWALTSGWVLRRWEIVRTENISMKYRDVPKPATPTPSR